MPALDILLTENHRSVYLVLSFRRLPQPLNFSIGVVLNIKDGVSNPQRIKQLKDFNIQSRIIQEIIMKPGLDQLVQLGNQESAKLPVHS